MAATTLPMPLGHSPVWVAHENHVSLYILPPCFLLLNVFAYMSSRITAVYTTWQTSAVPGSKSNVAEWQLALGGAGIVCGLAILVRCCLRWWVLSLGHNVMTKHCASGQRMR